MKSASCCSSCAAARPAQPCNSAQSLTDRSGLFLGLGLLGGVLGGLALARKLSPGERDEVSGLAIWQRELAKTRGEVAAGLLCGRVKACYEALNAGRPYFSSAALCHHLEHSILPGLALYQVLCEESPTKQEALNTLDALFEARIAASNTALQARLLKFFPDPFAIYRRYLAFFMPRQFPEGGWRWEWIENSENAFACTAHDCFYHNVLTAYGAPELTAHFCRLDDLLMERFPYFEWKRTMTIGRGDPVCDFRYERKAE